jgi:hypothetical protein
MSSCICPTVQLNGRTILAGLNTSCPTHGKVPPTVLLGHRKGDEDATQAQRRLYHEAGQ